MEIILSVNNLEVVYGGIKALQGISFVVNRGEIVTLIGANGAGKSSTLRAISGVVPAGAGSIIFKQKEITNLPSHLIARGGLSHVPEGRGVFTKLSVEENLIAGSYLRQDKPQIAKDMNNVYEMFPQLGERKKQLGGSLSGGEQQMLAIGRAIMSGAEMLLLDEPSMGLAPLIVQEIFGIIKRINSTGKTVLLVEQNANQALKVANRAYILETGRIIMAGNAVEMIDNPEIKRAYLGGH
ncbi:high-affinity branched-chain amino acid transport ATP-binding protein LivF [Methylomusa anaerophila]|uniref:High-affinity branched-chain amino acid transport ATP-binding protein LivF n=2 Tax=Methylomusa anaerophila TaxID=1930071 RepID=A0A348AJM2_9FIRM|nr:high-affinity branched-chain amino acid transport ATP-binding protein LivF [Methylomusa anaerophila]